MKSSPSQAWLVFGFIYRITRLRITAPTTSKRVSRGDLRRDVHQPKKSSLGHPPCQFRISAHMWTEEIVRVAKMNLHHSHSCREHKAASTHAVHRRMNPIVRNIATVRPQDVINTVRNDHGNLSGIIWPGEHSSATILRNEPMTKHLLCVLRTFLKSSPTKIQEQSIAWKQNQIQGFSVHFCAQEL
jgi:hypothetical protein